jgi:hypothetical protein
MSPLNPTLIISIIISLCIGGAAGAGIGSVVLRQPACTTAAPAETQQWQNLKPVKPLDDTGKTYR